MNPNAPGIPTIDVTEADRRRQAEPPALVVDVREANEFEAVRLESDVALVPMSVFQQRWQELPRDRPLLMMCAAGSRSAAATAWLVRNGYSDVANVAGGINEWQKAGLPVRRGPIAAGEGELPGT
jgi:rhodanese-related sulfurtransferase